MESREEIRDFLTTRRARITPEEAGLPAFGDNRRVPGLRREEVAMLAGVSVDYYIRLERGEAPGASEDVLEGVARALQLDQAERTHLEDLFRSAEPPASVEREEEVRPEVKRIVDAMVGMPSMVRNRRLEILHANTLGYGLYAGVYDHPARPANPARYVFLDPASRRFFDPWETAADNMVALLRAEAGRNPTDYALSELIDELSGSDDFRDRWSAHDVLFHRTGVSHLHHPAIGDLTLAYEDLVLPEDPGQTILVFTAEPGSESEDAIQRLAIWAPQQPWAKETGASAD